MNLSRRMAIQAAVFAFVSRFPWPFRREVNVWIRRGRDVVLHRARLRIVEVDAPTRCRR